MPKLPLSRILGTLSSRRAAMCSVGGALGGAALLALLKGTNWLENDDADYHSSWEKAAKAPQISPGTKSVILLFMSGGPSQMDLFDPKPTLNAHHGKTIPFDVEAPNKGNSVIAMGSPFRFSKFGKSGMELSNLLPHLGTVVDELTFIRSMHTVHNQHLQAVRHFNVGSVLGGRASLGAWACYGLGSVNANLPMYVVLPGSSLPVGGPFNWDSSWLPKKFGGVEFRSGPSPIFDLGTLDKGTIRQQQLNLSLLEDLNRIHLAKLEGASEFESRIESFELAARMQFAAPDCVDISKESLGTQRLYGIGEPETDAMGKRCLLARRLVERGVRFVQIMSENQVWDNHTGLQKNLTECCKAVDHPAAGLIKDLKARDLLQDTLVIFAGEFGRLPTAQDLDGRDHNPHAFTIWMAGGGVKQGYVHGTTDEFGYKAIEKRVSVADLHATVLKILGLDNSRLSYRAHGRDQTLTDINDATVVDEIIA